MAIDFPNSPATNDTYVVGSRTWVYDGEKWTVLTVTGSVPTEIEFNTQTATYTLALTDKNKMVQMNVGSANIVYVPPESSVDFPIGSSVSVLQIGSGKTQIVAGSGVTVVSANGLYLRAQWSAVTIIKRAADSWIVFGDTSTS